MLKKVNKGIAFFLCGIIEWQYHAWFRWCVSVLAQYARQVVVLDV
jgi:hypothetical protein